ncbi:MAG: hypothetical protein ACLFWH_14750 [Actinomycetota bacterium]
MTRLILPGLVIAVVTIAAVVSAAGEETRLELEYLESIRSQADQLAVSGTSLADVMSRLDEVDRDEFTTVFNGVGSDLDEAQIFAGEGPPTDSLIPVWALYRQALNAWDEGVRGLSSAILQAADDPDDITVINTTSDSLALLRAGDALFQDLKNEFQREEIPEPVAPPPDVSMSPTDAGLVSRSTSYVAAARRSTSQLGLRPELRVSQVVSDPAWQMNVEEQPVVPETETIAFSAVITNSGNVASEPESLTMELTGGAEPVVANAEVPALEAGEQTAVEFSPLEVIPDTLYEVRVTLELGNPDADMTDNELRVQFTVSSE